ncbi:MAG: hypothetical protein U5L45_16110 [Saprospiraceae bacterium]|nr:hypothetical protein [Saprospiraceae bacterium]
MFASLAKNEPHSPFFASEANNRLSNYEKIKFSCKTKANVRCKTQKLLNY